MINLEWLSGRRNNVHEKAKELIDHIGQLGSSSEVRVAQAKVEEAMIWIDQHIVVQQVGSVTPQSLRRIVLDIFERIAAAIEAKNSGDNTALQAHISEIDAHLGQLDTSDADEQSRISTIEQGLGKIADAVAPTVPVDTGTGSDTGSTAGSDAGQPTSTQATDGA